MIPVIAAGDTLRFVWEWVPSLGVNVSFYIDGLSLTFALLITGIGALVMLYSARYLAGHVHQARFSLYLTSFMLAMIGKMEVVLFLFSSVSSFLFFILFRLFLFSDMFLFSSFHIYRIFVFPMFHMFPLFPLSMFVHVCPPPGLWFVKCSSFVDHCRHMLSCNLRVIMGGI